jgi:hypothetical protein
MTSLHQLAVNNVERQIEANYTAFGKTPEPDDYERIYAQCLSIAEKEQSGAYFNALKVDDLVLIKGAHSGGLIKRILDDTAYLAMISRPGELVPYKMCELKLV